MEEQVVACNAHLIQIPCQLMMLGGDGGVERQSLVDPLGFPRFPVHQVPSALIVLTHLVLGPLLHLESGGASGDFAMSSLE